MRVLAKKLDTLYMDYFIIGTLWFKRKQKKKQIEMLNIYVFSRTHQVGL